MISDFGTKDQPRNSSSDDYFVIKIKISKMHKMKNQNHKSRKVFKITIWSTLISNAPITGDNKDGRWRTAVCENRWKWGPQQEFQEADSRDKVISKKANLWFSKKSWLVHLCKILPWSRVLQCYRRQTIPMEQAKIRPSVTLYSRDRSSPNLVWLITSATPT